MILENGPLPTMSEAKREKSTHEGLHHIEVYVSNLNHSEQFWSWFLSLLGYEEYQSWDEGFSFIHNQVYLVFVQTAEKHQKTQYHRCRTGLNHLAFWAESRRQVDQICDSLREKGLRILYEDRHPFAGGPEHYAVYFEDPDRIKVELVAPDQ